MASQSVLDRPIVVELQAADGEEWAGQQCCHGGISS